MNLPLKRLLRSGLLGVGFLWVVASMQAQTNFAVLTSDGAWTWFNDSRALFNNGALYFGYTRAADGRVVLSALDLPSGKVTNLWTSSLTQEATTMSRVYWPNRTARCSPFIHATRTTSFLPTDFPPAPLRSRPPPRARTIHSHPHARRIRNHVHAPLSLTPESGRVYNFARYLNYNPNVFTSSDGGATWSTPQILIQTGTGSTRPYVKYCSDNNSRIDLIYTDAHPDNFTTSLYHLYYQGGSFLQSDGTFLKSFANLPILHDSVERGTVIYQYNDAAQTDFNQWIATGRAWCWEIGYQTNGNPVCVFR